MTWLVRSSRRRGSAASRSTSCAPDPAACSGCEPLVEVATDEGRVGYGPVAAHQVADLIDAGMLSGAPHGSSVGVVEEMPWLRDQTRVTFARVGVDRSVGPRRLRGARGPVGPASARCGSARRTSSRRSWPPGCVAAVVPGSRPASSGARCARPRPTRSTSAATPTRATAGRSPTGMLMEGRPVRPDRGHGHRRAGHGCHQGLGLHAGRSTPMRSPPCARRSTSPAPTGWLGSDVLGCGRSFDLSVRVGRGLLRLRRGDRDAREPRGASAASCAPSRRSRRSRACSASRRWSTTC